MRLIDIVLNRQVGGYHITCIPYPGRIEFLQLRNEGVTNKCVPVLIYCIPYHYRRMISVAPNPVGVFFPYLFIPAMVLPVHPFILEHHAVFVSEIVPEIRHQPYTYPHCIPAKRSGIINKHSPHPFPVPWKRLTIRILKKPVKSYVRPPQYYLFAIEIEIFPPSFKVSHSEVFRKPISNNIFFNKFCFCSIQEWIRRSPFFIIPHLNDRLKYRFVIAGCYSLK